MRVFVENVAPILKLSAERTMIHGHTVEIHQNNFVVGFTVEIHRNGSNSQ